MKCMCVESGLVRELIIIGYIVTFDKIHRTDFSGVKHTKVDPNVDRPAGC